MKVLAIRGENLASLEGAFELVLSEGPLAEAGVFAICGPTGAGKSTLLDAMCLALFDTAPRLEGRGRGRVGREAEEGEWLTVQDPRSLLRKGAGQGWAEVDFEGVDGHTYRARWEARRSRGRADGKLQPSKMSIRNLGDDWNEGGRKTDVRAEIERRLGLTFDQFRRSVLLAQGDFAAFLEADARDRADLLERMTGTEIYGLISMEAHARLGDERRGVERIAARLEEVRVYAPEERASREANLVEVSRKAKQDELALADAARAVRWHAERDGLRKEETEAVEREQQLASQLALVETERGRLDALKAALPLRPALEELDRAEKQANELDEQRRRVHAASRAARAEVEAAQKARERAERTREAIETERERSRPTLEQARALDGTLLDLSRRLQVEREHHASATERTQTAAAAVDAVRQRVAEVEKRLEQAAAWLEAHPRAAEAEREWSRIEEHLSHRVDLASRKAALDATWRDAREATAHHETRCAEAEGRWRGLRHARLEAEAVFREARDEARRAPSAELAEVRERWSAQRTALETLLGVADRAQSALRAEERQREIAAGCADRAAMARADAERAEQEVKEAELRSREAQRQRDALRARLDLSAHRSELVDGEACPLCGSESHPFAEEAPVVSELLHEADARTAQLTSERTAAARRSAEARRTSEAEREAASRALAEAARWADELNDARARYRETAARLATLRGPDAPALGAPDHLPAAPHSGDAPDWGPLFEIAAVSSGTGTLLDDAARQSLDAARVEAEGRLAVLDRTARERRQAERDRERLRAEFETLRDAQGEAEATRTAAEAALARARSDRALVERDRTRVAERLASSNTVLARPLSGYADWTALPAQAVLTQVRDDVRERRARLDAQREANRQQATLVPERTRLESELTAESQRTTASAARLLQLEQERAERAETQRALIAELEARIEACACEIEAATPAANDVVGGSAVDAAEARFLAAIEAAKATARRTLAELTATTRGDAEQTAELARVSGAFGEARVRQSRARTRLDEALDGSEHDEVSLRRLLSHDAAEIERWRHELEGLDEERKKQQAVVLERTRRREAHEANDPPRLDGEHAQAAHAKAYERLDHTRELVHAARTQLERDDQNRAQRDTIQAEHEAARTRLGVWETLQSLIGSASGNKLRVFAQSLTLELLLEHANHHLLDLAPRYALARVPGEDLALQVVDHEMGEDVRAVSSLSGGESFLVALGLALGLASLTSQRSRVDSLFIDEGFGALDPASLELVLSTLDTLQASGRQVGLISHVPAIAERFPTRVQVVAAGPAKSRIELIT
ncbi:MAG: AAA family ATPase [Sandaracinaceae bacterium]